MGQGRIEIWMFDLIHFWKKAQLARFKQQLRPAFANPHRAPCHCPASCTQLADWMTLSKAARYPPYLRTRVHLESYGVIRRRWMFPFRMFRSTRSSYPRELNRKETEEVGASNSFRLHSVGSRPGASPRTMTALSHSAEDFAVTWSSSAL